MRGNENDVGIVEFAEKICGSELPAWQKEALIKIIQLDRPVYITLKKTKRSWRNDTSLSKAYGDSLRT